MKLVLQVLEMLRTLRLATGGNHPVLGKSRKRQCYQNLSPGVNQKIPK